MTAPSAGPKSQVPWTWWPMLILAFSIAGYALSFLVRGEAAFPPGLRESFSARLWGIYPHVLFGSIALALGPFQFRRGLLLRNRPLHRRLGLAYVIGATMTGVVGMYMAVYAYGGLATHLGFGLLGLGTFVTTLKAYFHIRKHEVAPHREWMIRSYALIFAAVTLRLEIPLLVPLLGDFTPAYRIVAWLCWVPNMLMAEWLVRSSKRTSGADLPRHSFASA